MELNAIISSVIEFIVTFISIPGNILIIAVYARKKRTSYSVLAIGLGINDLIISFASPVRLYHYFLFGKHTSSAFCIACGGIFYLGLNSSIFMAALISFNRYFAICKPYNRRLSPRSSAISVAVSSGLSVLASVPLGSMFELVSYSNDHFNCSIPPRHHRKAALYVYILTTIHFLTIVMTLAMYALVLRRLRMLGKNRVHQSSVSGSFVKVKNRMKSNEMKMNNSVTDDDQQATRKLDLLDIPSTSVTNASCIPLSSLDNNHLYPSSSVVNTTSIPLPSVDNSQSAGPSTSDGRSSQVVSWSNRRTNVALITPRPRLIPEGTLKTTLSEDAPARKGPSLREEATRRYLIIIMLLYLTMWLPNLFVLLFGYKPELRDTNYTAYTVLMVFSRFPALNRIYHFVISLFFKKSFRGDCKEVLVDTKNTLFRNL